MVPLGKTAAVRERIDDCDPLTGDTARRVDEESDHTRRRREWRTVRIFSYDGRLAMGFQNSRIHEIVTESRAIAVKFCIWPREKDIRRNEWALPHSNIMPERSVYRAAGHNEQRSCR